MPLVVIEAAALQSETCAQECEPVTPAARCGPGQGYQLHLQTKQREITGNSRTHTQSHAYYASTGARLSNSKADLGVGYRRGLGGEFRIQTSADHDSLRTIKNYWRSFYLEQM